MNKMVGALDGLIILDLSRILAGPFATQMLSDLGATVWKVEPFWGDDTRTWGPPFLKDESAYYLSVNRGKQSLAINIKDPRGSELVAQLSSKCDVFVENYKAGDLARFGLDYQTLSSSHPSIIYASITGFGQTGPRAREPGYDAVLQAETGVMSVTGEPNGKPIKIGVAWIDLLAGLTATVGILSSVLEREKRGQGQHIDLSLFDVGVMAMLNQAQAFLTNGAIPAPMGTAHPQIVPYQAFKARDGWFMLAVGNDKQYKRAVTALGYPELWEMRFRTNEKRVLHRNILIPKLEKIFLELTIDKSIEILTSAGVPTTRIRNLEEVFSSEQTDARSLLWKANHPELGQLPLIANPLQHMSSTPAAINGYPPMLGEHTHTILHNTLGLENSEIENLILDGVVALKKSHPRPA